MQYADDEQALRRCYPVIRELRPHLSEAAFLAAVAAQREQGYRLGFIEEAGAVVACVGFRLAHFLAWGRVLYIDDLITAEAARGQGHGQALLIAVEALARELGCDALHLDSGHHRHAAHRLYLNAGFNISSHHFSKQLKA